MAPAPATWGWLTGCNDLTKSVRANNYLAGQRKSSSLDDWRDNWRCIRGTTIVAGCVGGGNPRGLGPDSFVGGGI
jgi:hypothetical protein